MRYRIGIDVGGTFTHAAVINADTLELIAKEKVPTTHYSKEGVAQGVSCVLENIIKKIKLFFADEILLVAHSTTQATNALLEGDVEKVAIITVGNGLEGKRAASETNLKEVKINNTHFILTNNVYIEENNDIESKIKAEAEKLINDGFKTYVAASPFSVENPEKENLIVNIFDALNFPCTPTYEISLVYGLRTRTRTCIVNAAILPKMLQVAKFTLDCINNLGLKTSLMVMRSDGGIMEIKEMYKRPILTILSGPAASVAGALNYAKASDAIFIEVGGTSTDISLIYQGKPIIKMAKIGGNPMFIKTLDITTLGIAGGSLPRIKNKNITTVGPRSAHIAGLPYITFSKKGELTNLKVNTFAPLKNDPNDYLYLENNNGKKFAFTPSCAATYLDLRNDGNKECCELALEILSHYLKKEKKQIAKEILELSLQIMLPTVEELIKMHPLDKQDILLLGGGGGAENYLRPLAEKLKMNYKICNHGDVISSIGAALAMLKESQEKSVINPTEEDILNLRKKVEEKILSQGANPETLETKIEVDEKKQLVRATAIGSLEVKKIKEKKITVEEGKNLLLQKYNMPHLKIDFLDTNNFFLIYQITELNSKFFGLKKGKKSKIVVLNLSGEEVIKLIDFKTEKTQVCDLKNKIKILFDELKKYTDGGIEIPKIYLILRKKLLDFTALTSLDQMLTLIELEISSFTLTEEVILLFK